MEALATPAGCAATTQLDIGRQGCWLLQSRYGESQVGGRGRLPTEDYSHQWMLGWDCCLEIIAGLRMQKSWLSIVMYSVPKVLQLRRPGLLVMLERHGIALVCGWSVYDALFGSPLHSESRWFVVLLTLGVDK
jgi:hypothetical protein